MPDATISLREITRDTVRAICDLKVSPEQQKFVAPNAVSIAQAHFDQEFAWFRAIYRGDDPVGFVMLHIDRAKPACFLWRFMIDARYQGQGLGHRALELVIAFATTLEGVTAVGTSCVPGEGSPGPFYEKLGFKFTGEIDAGELVMRREL